MTKLHTRMDEARLARHSAEQAVRKPRSSTRGADFGTSVKGVTLAAVATDKWHSGFTPSE